MQLVCDEDAIHIICQFTHIMLQKHLGVALLKPQYIRGALHEAQVYFDSERTTCGSYLVPGLLMRLRQLRASETFRLCSDCDDDDIQIICQCNYIMLQKHKYLGATLLKLQDINSALQEAQVYFYFQRTACGPYLSCQLFSINNL